MSALDLSLNLSHLLLLSASALGAGANLPAELADLRPERLDEASWRALLCDAEAMVLAQLGRDLTT